MRSVSGVSRTKELSPFAFEEVHHTGVEGRSVARAKWHDAETVFLIVRSEKSKLLLVTETNGNLVITSLVVQGDEVETTIGVAEVVDSVITARDRILERQSDLVEATV
jgi:hypothetical protein